MRLRDRRAIACANPIFGFVADKAIDHRIGRAAMRVPARRVAERQHVERMEGDHAGKAIVVAFCGMDRLRPPHLLRRLAGEAQRARYAVALHRRLGRQKPAQAGNAEAGMRIGVAAGLIAETRARSLDGRRVLAIARHRVILGIHADRRPGAVGPVGAKGGRHPARAFLDRKALVLQTLDIPGGRLVFAPGGLAEIEDRPRPCRQRRLDVVQTGKRGRLSRVRHRILHRSKKAVKRLAKK